MLRFFSHPLNTMPLLYLALLAFLPHLVILTAQPLFVFHYCYDDKGNYTRTSAYHTNLNTLLSNFTSDTKIDYGFYNSSYGQNPDTVNALGLCRGDVKPDSCRSCLNNTTILLPQLCPNQKEAVGFYDLCMFRYSNRSIFGKYDASGANWFLQNKDTTHTVLYDVLWESLDKVMNKSAAGDSRRKFCSRK